MFAVYGYNKADDILCGCSLFPTIEEAGNEIHAIFADVIRNSCIRIPEDIAAGSDQGVLDWAEKEEEYAENLDALTFETPELVYCIEPVDVP